MQCMIFKSSNRDVRFTGTITLFSSFFSHHSCLTHENEGKRTNRKEWRRSDGGERADKNVVLVRYGT